VHYYKIKNLEVEVVCGLQLEEIQFWNPETTIQSKSYSRSHCLE